MFSSCIVLIKQPSKFRIPKAKMSFNQTKIIMLLINFSLENGKMLTMGETEKKILESIEMSCYRKYWKLNEWIRLVIIDSIIEKFG